MTTTAIELSLPPTLPSGKREAQWIRHCLNAWCRILVHVVLTSGVIICPGSVCDGVRQFCAEFVAIHDLPVHTCPTPDFADMEARLKVILSCVALLKMITSI